MKRLILALLEFWVWWRNRKPAKVIAFTASLGEENQIDPNDPHVQAIATAYRKQAKRKPTMVGGG